LTVIPLPGDENVATPSLGRPGVVATHAENSEVLPDGSVAVAVITEPLVRTLENDAAKVATPVTSVVTFVEPM
jgi:hypothetical protein